MRSGLSQDSLSEVLEFHSVGIQHCNAHILCRGTIAGSTRMAMALQYDIVGSNISIYMCSVENGIVFTLLSLLYSSPTDAVSTTLETSVAPCVMWAQNGPITIPSIDRRAQRRIIVSISDMF